MVLWLQGGPGGSSLFGFFVEHGPFFVRKDGSVGRRTTSWALHFNMLYVDQPAGTGFSFTEDEAGYAENQDDVARDLYEALRQFYIMFPMLRDNDLYVTGESYGGKSRIYLQAHQLHQGHGSSRQIRPGHFLEDRFGE